MYNRSNYTGTCFLDRIRFEEGIDNFIRYFHNLKAYDPGKAADLINDANLRFSSLFLLQHEIKKSTRSMSLNSRNENALEITNSILLSQTENINKLYSNNRDLVYSTLKWMFETGCIDDGMNNQYDKVLETTAALLTKLYKDRGILHKTTEMIFKRYRKQLFIYDLVWAFFECRNADSLMFIAEYLKSEHPKDVELARKLLSFIPYIASGKNMNPQTEYLYCARWIQENSPFLYYTGESFQQTNKPIPYAVSLEAKYLCKPMSKDDKRSLKLTGDDGDILKKFAVLDDAARLMLSNYSYILHQNNFYLWNIWIHSPVSEQLKYVRSMPGGLS